VLHEHYHSLCFIVKIQHRNNKRKQSSLFCATLYNVNKVKLSSKTRQSTGLSDHAGTVFLSHWDLITSDVLCLCYWLILVFHKPQKMKTPHLWQRHRIYLSISWQNVAVSVNITIKHAFSSAAIWSNAGAEGKHNTKPNSTKLYSKITQFKITEWSNN